MEGTFGCAVKRKNSWVQKLFNKYLSLSIIIKNEKVKVSSFGSVWYKIEFAFYALFGAALMFMGIRIYSYSLKLAATLAGSLCIYYLIQKLGSDWDVETWVKVLVGILGGVLSTPLFYNLALLLTEFVCLLFGALCGAILARAINQGITASSDTSLWWGFQVLVYVIMIGLLAYASFKYDEMMVIVNTCITGAYMMLHGILFYLAKEGLDKAFKTSLEKLEFSSMDKWQTVYVFTMLVCFVAGMITQCIFQHDEGYLHLKEQGDEE